MTPEKIKAIRQKLGDTRAELLALAHELTEEQWEHSAFSEGSEWRVVDVFRHIADSERGMTNLMIQVKQGGEGVPADFDLHRWNRRAVSKLQDKTPEELLEGMHTSRQALWALIDTLEPDDWEKKGRHASLRIMTIEEICHLIADHELNHANGIREAMAG